MLGFVLVRFAVGTTRDSHLSLCSHVHGLCTCAPHAHTPESQGALKCADVPLTDAVMELIRFFNGLTNNV